MLPRAALLLVLLVLVVACSTPGDESAQDEAPELFEELRAPETDLDDDTAAAIGDTTISRAEVDARLEQAVEADEALAEQLEGAQGAQVLSMFRAETLTIMIQTHLILDGAEELGVEPTEARIEQSREELVAELGGQEQFDAAFAQSGMSEEALEEQLRANAVLEAVGEHLVAEGALEDAEAPEGAEELSEVDLAVQQWLGEQILGADVEVHPEYGQWDPQSGQVRPAAGMPALPGETPGE